MALRIPTRDDLQRLAQSNYFTLSHGEVEAYHTLAGRRDLPSA
jgi:hypothetical protein